MMKKIKLLPRAMALGALAAISASAMTSAHAESAAGPVKPELKSLQQHFKTPEWLQDAKLGVYTHWGPVTQAIRHHDQGNFGWYGRFMYQQGHAAMEYHKKHFGDPKDVPYTKIMEEFTAEKFDAAEWAELIAGAGAKFGGPVSIHHDNYAMWDSDIHAWNSVNIGPKRDITGELEKEYRKRGMKFLGAFHHGFTYHFYKYARQNGYQGTEAEFAKLYGPVDKRDEKKEFIPREFQEQWLALVNEYVTKYNPDLIYYDFGLGWQDQDIQYQMYADYYNYGIKEGKEVTVLQKERAPILRSYSTMDLERGRMDELTPYTWTTDTSAGAWFYHPDSSWEDSNTMIDMFIDIVSKNGIMLLNVAPDFEGSIPPEMKSLLKDFGSWTSQNGEGIYETRPWPIYGEGSVGADSGHFKIENSKARKEAKYGGDDIRYTVSKDGKTQFAFFLGWPESEQVILNGFDVKSAGGKVTLFGYDKAINFEVLADGRIQLDIPKLADLPNDFAYGFKFDGFDIQPRKQGLFYQPNSKTIGAEMAAIHGYHISEGENADGQTVINNWTSWWGSVNFLWRNKFKDSDFTLRAKMRNLNDTNELSVKIFNDGGEVVTLQVNPQVTGDEFAYVDLGDFHLNADGVFQIKIGSEEGKFVPRSMEIEAIQIAPIPVQMKR